MREIFLKFNSIEQPVIIVPESGSYVEFFWNNLIRLQRPADRITYQKTYNEVLQDFLVLANQAKQVFGFDWDLSRIDQTSFNQWHRDIECFDLSQHPPWSQQKGDLFIDLHLSLHQAEQNDSSRASLDRKLIGIKWFEPSVPWTTVPEFELAFCQGDVMADYPHVGKSPWISLLHKDVENLQQSCRLPDACPPGFNIHLVGVDESQRQQVAEKNKEEQYIRLSEWYDSNEAQLKSMFSKQQMLYYHGGVRVGRVKDLNQLSLIRCAELTGVSLV